MTAKILPVPHLYQQEYGECLPACAAVDVLYQQGTLAQLHEHLRNGQPCLAFINTRELPYWDEENNHAVVVVGLDDKFIYLNDPAFPNSPIEVTRGDFDLAWLERDEFYAVITRK